MDRELIVARRRDEETTFAVIKWRGVEEHKFLFVLKAALAKWRKSSPSARQAFDEIGGAFNIGDLANILTRSTNEFLTEAGIEGLDIYVYSQDTPAGWDFDTLLLS